MSGAGRARRPLGDLVLGVIERFGLPASEHDRLCRLVELLSRDRAAPTSVREPERIIERHLADSLAALILPEVASARALVDLGSGAGLPGIPLALALPRARVFLLESSRRRCEFLARALAVCAVENAEVINSRAECWQGGIGRAEVVTARAVGPLDVVAEYAAPLLRLGGVAVVWRGCREPEEEAAAARAGELLGLSLVEPLAVRPFPAARHHHLHVMRKERQTPPVYPRRPGIARKRPLGALF